MTNAKKYPVRTKVYVEINDTLVLLQDVDLHCIHRGEETRKVDCTSCEGKTQLRVFACTIKGECLLSSRKSSGVTNCDTCTDRKAL